LAHARLLNEQLAGFAAERPEFDPLGPTQIGLFDPDGFVDPSVGLVQELAEATRSCQDAMTYFWSDMAGPASVGRAFRGSIHRRD
jgi:hypothetical protein